MTLSESAQNLKVSIPEAKAKLCENCKVFFNSLDSRNGNCPFCGSVATEFYLNYLKRIMAVAREQAA